MKTSLIPRLLPSFCRILYSMRQNAGEEPGNEARLVKTILLIWHSAFLLLCEIKNQSTLPILC